MERRKKLLLIVTIILLAITIIWAIAVYQHIQAYNRMMQEPWEFYGLRESIFTWGNGPILMVSGCILAFAWIFLIAEWCKVLSSKTNPCMQKKGGYLRLLYIASPSIVVTYSKPFSISRLASSTVLAVLTKYSLSGLSIYFRFL